jgi:hypothetical protein
MTEIEKIYKKLCSKEQKYIYYNKFQVVKARLEESYYPFISQANPYMTDHGEGHINRILEKLYRLLKPHLPITGNPNGRIIDVENLHLLLHSLLWHDIGNLFGRHAHNDKRNIKKVFNLIKEFLYDEPRRSYIPLIAEGHSGAGSIERNINNPSITIHDYTIYPRFLSALIRIADEIDEDNRRIESRITPPPESEAYWAFCRMNQAIIPEYIFDPVKGASFEIKVNSNIYKNSLCKILKKGKNNVMAFKEYVFRINKINNERIYCNKFLSDAFYFNQIEKVSVEINILDENDVRIESMTFILNDNIHGIDILKQDDVKQLIKRYSFRS